MYSNKWKENMFTIEMKLKALTCIHNGEHVNQICNQMNVRNRKKYFE